jgi:hypothetical protein
MWIDVERERDVQQAMGYQLGGSFNSSHFPFVFLKSIYPHTHTHTYTHTHIIHPFFYPKSLQTIDVPAFGLLSPYSKFS